MNKKFMMLTMMMFTSWQAMGSWTTIMNDRMPTRRTENPTSSTIAQQNNRWLDGGWKSNDAISSKQNPKKKIAESVLSIDNTDSSNNPWESDTFIDFNDNSPITMNSQSIGVETRRNDQTNINGTNTSKVKLETSKQWFRQLPILKTPEGMQKFYQSIMSPFKSKSKAQLEDFESETPEVKTTWRNFFNNITLPNITLSQFNIQFQSLTSILNRIFNRSQSSETSMELSNPKSTATNTNRKLSSTDGSTYDAGVGVESANPFGDGSFTNLFEQTTNTAGEAQQVLSRSILLNGQSVADIAQQARKELPKSSSSSSSSSRSPVLNNPSENDLKAATKLRNKLRQQVGMADNVESNSALTSAAPIAPENSAIATNLQYIPGYPGDNGSLKGAGISDRRQEKLTKTKLSAQSAPAEAAATFVPENNSFSTTGELHELLPNYTNFTRANHPETRVNVSPENSAIATKTMTNPQAIPNSEGSNASSSLISALPDQSQFV